MNVDLVMDPKDQQVVLPQYANLIGGFEYKTGNRYAEFMHGDKVAGYGLTALIAGGAGAVAVKTGLFAKLWKLIATAAVALWKLIIVVFAALAAFVRRLFARVKELFRPKSRRAQSNSKEQSQLPASTASELHDFK